MALGLDWRRVGVEVARHATRYAVRENFGPRRGAPIEDMVDALANAGKRAMGIHDGRIDDDVNYGPVSPEVADEFWRGNVPKRDWSIELICGAQGTGKSVLMAKLCEIYSGMNGKRVLWLGAEQKNLDTLINVSATAITFDDAIDLMEKGRIRNEVLCIDDAVQFMNQYSAGTKTSQAIHQFLAIGVRKTDSHVLMATQETGLLDRHGMQPSIVWSKPPLGNFEDFERGGQLKRSKRALRAYKEIPSSEWIKWCWVEEVGAVGSFQGLVPVDLPEGWSDRMSRAM